MKRITILMVCFFSNVVVAGTYDEDSSGLPYDSIINRLSSSAPRPVQENPFDTVKIHVGVGYTNSIMSIPHPSGSQLMITPKGYQASLGIDLFSEYWFAEGVLLNYGDTKVDRARVGLHEFDLKVMYRQPIARTWGFRAGGGLASRYIRVQYLDVPNASVTEVTTPATLLTGGLDAYVSDKFSVGLDVAFRNSLIDDTPDKSSLDMTVRFDGRF